MPFKITVSDEFCAAMQLNVTGPCSKLHGHTYLVSAIFFAKDLNEAGIAGDYHMLQKQLKLILENIDHSLLNEHPWFYELPPSSENIAYVIFKKLSPNCDLKLISVQVQESKNCVVSYEE